MDQNGKCPSCGKSIGYKPPNAAIEKREGHFIILTPDEYDKEFQIFRGFNPSFVAETPRKYVQDLENEMKVENQNISKKGYERIFEQNFENVNYTLRNLSSIGTRTYSLIIHSIFNALYQNLKLSENELKLLMNEKNNANQNLEANNEALKYLWQIMRILF